MKQQQYRGTGVALVTPFRNGRIDFPALERVIEHVIAGGVDFLVSLGTTGEAVTLSDREVREVLDATIRINNGRKPLVAGVFGDNDTARLVQKVREFDFTGIDVIMSSSPAYNKPNQEGIYRHYMALAEVAPRPVIIYNVPSRTGSNVEAETVLRLAEASDQFFAVKEASGDLQQVMTILKYKPDDFLVLSGDDLITLPMIGCGGDGVISVIANALPGPFAGMARAALAGNYDEAQRLNAQLLDIHPWLYIDGNPAGVKGALELLGVCSKEVRLPLAPISDEHLAALQKELERAGVLEGSRG